MHHGAGSSGLSFATCADEIRKILPKAGFLSIDARGHGRTVTVPISEKLVQNSPSTAAVAQAEAKCQVELDLRLETLSRDLVYVIGQTQTKLGWENLPDIVLVGHSLGGAVITDVAKNGELGPKLLAYAVLDVVEGKDPLSILQKGLQLTPVRFCHGCSSEHGDISVYTTNALPFIGIGNRMAVCNRHRTWVSLIPFHSNTDPCLQHSFSHNPKHNVSSSICSFFTL